MLLANSEESESLSAYSLFKLISVWHIPVVTDSSGTSASEMKQKALDSGSADEISRLRFL